MTNRLKLAVGVAVVVTMGCSSGNKVIRPTVGDPSKIAGPRNANERVVEYDLNQDGKADVWSFLATVSTPDGKTAEKLVRKELDINWDNRIDIVRFYGENEQVEKEAYDLDFDGKIDQTNFFEKNVVVRKERDLNYDGRSDLWIFYEKGQIARKERDTNHDGKIDYWEYWEGDQVDRIGEDVDGDGQIDRWTKNPQTSDS